MLVCMMTSPGRTLPGENVSAVAAVALNSAGRKLPAVSEGAQAGWLTKGTVPAAVHDGTDGRIVVPCRYCQVPFGFPVFGLLLSLQSVDKSAMTVAPADCTRSATPTITNPNRRKLRNIGVVIAAQRRSIYRADVCADHFSSCCRAFSLKAVHKRKDFQQGLFLPVWFLRHADLEVGDSSNGDPPVTPDS